MTSPVLQQVEVFHEFSGGRSVGMKLFSVRTHRKLLGTLKLKSVDRTRLPTLPSSWQLRAEEKSSHRILHWIPASKFLAFSSIFLQDPAQTCRPKVYQKKHRVVFDIKVSVTRLKLRQEKIFL